MNNDANLEAFERRAAEQRKRIHDSVTELQQLTENGKAYVRERLDPKRQARQHFWTIAGTASLVALAFGYSFAGIFAE